jgi:hypothetical protein
MQSHFNQLFAALLFALIINASATVRYVDVNSGSPAQPYTNWTHAAVTMQDAVDYATDGDLILVANGIYQTGGRVASGSLTNRVAVTKAVTLKSVDGASVTTIVGYQIPTAKNGDAALRCVYLTNGAVLDGFTLTNGATRAAGTQEIEQSGGGVWCASPSATVSNCVFWGNTANAFGGVAYGGSLTNCAFGTNSAFYGGGAASATLCGCTFYNNTATSDGGGVFNAKVINCDVRGGSAYYGGGANSCKLINCTVIANYASQDGGGAYDCTLTNCSISGNSARNVGGGSYQGTLDRCILNSNQAQQGGGAYLATLNNCTFAYNSATYGGGSYGCRLNNCSLSLNVATYGGGGGGTYYGILNNCIIYYNTDYVNWSSPNCMNVVTMDYCCTTPLPTAGTGNISAQPLFVSQSGNDLHLTSASPCINAGLNSYAAYPIDLDGNSRIKGGAVDIGAYEFQTPASSISYTWLQQYGLATDGSADFIDTDHDGMNNWQEWIAGTSPVNAQSVMRLVSLIRTNTHVTVTWQSVSNRNYAVERRVNLGSHSGFVTLASNIAGQANTTSYTDMNAVSVGLPCYRIATQTADYQVQSAHSIIPFTWLQQYGLATDGSADFIDTDHDGMNNRQEWIAGTDPTNPLSVLKMLPAAQTNNLQSRTLTWQSVNGKTYYLQRSTNLLLQPTFLSIKSNITGLTGRTSFTDTNVTNAKVYYYRVGVQ